MNPKHLRFGVALVLVGFLFVFFVPVIYDPTLCQFTSPAFPCPSNPAGLKSIWFALFGWGAAYEFEGGYSASLYGNSFTTLGVLLFVALPTGVAGVCCLAPEIVKKSLASRICFTLFGGFAFAFSVLIFASMLGEGFNLALATLAVTLFSFGSTMVIYGVRPRLFQITTEQPSQP